VLAVEIGEDAVLVGEHTYLLRRGMIANQAMMPSSAARAV
jgi:hypothetical protein